MAQTQDVEIPQPLTSGTVDHPDAVQEGTPAGPWENYAPAKASAKAKGPWENYAPTPAAAAKPAAGVPPVTPPPAAGPKAPYEPIPGLVPRIVGEATEAYHHPWEAAKGLAKGMVDLAGNVIPSVQSQDIDTNAPEFKNNPYISSGVKQAITSEPKQTPRDLSGGVVSGMMQPQNTAQQGGYDAAQAYGAVRGALEVGHGIKGALTKNPAEAARVALTRPADTSLPKQETLAYHEAEVEKTTQALKEAEKTANHYAASPKGPPEKVNKALEKAQAASDEAKRHYENFKQGAAPDKPITLSSEQQAAQNARPQAAPAPLPTMAKLGAPKVAENVKTPGQVRPETFPQTPTEKPVVEPGQRTLANDQGTVGMRKMLTEGTPQAAPAEAPKAEASTAPATMAKLGKPERGNLKQLKVDETGKVVDTKPEDRLDTLLQQALKPAEEVKPAAEIKAPATEAPKVRGQERRQETTPVAEERRTGERRNAAGIRVDEEGNPVMSPDVQGHWQSAAFGEKPAEDIGAKAREANPEPTRAETKGEAAKPTLEKPVPATEPGLMKAGEEGKEQPKSAAEYHPAVREQVTALPDEKLKQLAKAHGLNPDEYNFKTRDEGRHRTERDQLAEEVTKQMGDDEKINIGRNAEQLEHKAEMANKTKAERAASLFPRLRGPVDEFGNPKVAGGAPEAPDLSKIAAEHNKAEGREELKPTTVETSPRAKETAKAYEDMKHDPNNPEVKESYAALIDDTKKQWDRLEKAGIKIVPTDEDPYKSHEEMMDDLKNNKQLKVFRGGNPLPEDHPLNKIDPDTGEKYNTMFRAVHDAFGHGMEGHDFSEKGEENAWNVHRQMMSPKAIPAMTTETRGQTSWFFNHGEAPGRFAEQKAGILPDYANEPTPNAKAALDHIKSGKDYAVLTAENPNNKRLSPEENATRNRALVADLKDKGYEPIPVEGNNKDVEGRTERSFLIKDIPPKEAAELGRKHGQKSVLTTQGLHHLDTDTINPSDNSKLMTGEEAKKQDYSTKVGDQDFSVPIDFDKRINSKGSPVDEFGNPTVSGGSQAAKAKAKELPTGDQLIKKYGESSGDPVDTTFILADGRGVKNTGSDHDTMLGGKATDKNPPREQFIADGNIRVRPRMGIGNREVSMSIPESGINTKQLAYIEKMAPQLRSGAVLIEVGKAGGDYRILSHGDATTENLGKALRELGPIKNEKGAPIDEFGNPTVSGGSQGAGTAAAKEAALPALAEEHLTPEEKSGILKSPRKTEKFVENMMSMPKVQEFVDAAVGGQGARKWYQRSQTAVESIAKEAPEYFKEPGDHEKFTGLLAASSPRQSVAMNIREALGTWKEYVDAGRPEGQALKKLLYDNFTNKGGKTPNAMKALAGEPMWPDLTKNRAFKVPSFRDNLMGVANRVTNDGWMGLFSGIDADKLSDPENYHPISVLTREAAKQLNWEPKEAQAAIWSFIKTFYEKGGEVSPENIRHLSEDMADIVRFDPDTRSILKQLKVNLDQLDKRIADNTGEKPEITIRPSFSSTNSARQLSARIKAARGEAPIPKDIGLFDIKPESEDESTEFNPEQFKTQTNEPLEKLGKKKSPLKKML